MHIKSSRVNYTVSTPVNSSRKGYCVSGSADREIRFSIIMFCNHNVEYNLQTDMYLYSVMSKTSRSFFSQFTLAQSVQFLPNQPSLKQGKFLPFSWANYNMERTLFMLGLAR